MNKTVFWLRGTVPLLEMLAQVIPLYEKVKCKCKSRQTKNWDKELKQT